ncbi:TetR/AcrR family transcriptional regulator [Actinokineospora iranica]|uniref:DNA-binding transcriptional regulator, AcrR family n=1 Tax=Actinokineospora iranica TaxID=1271860 RepID=A0A1G6XFK1_9PSEU|nr:TetR family transcriptional regulator [Actinokineospora iranica]SDD76107.1 DNA-binding transcriptional regulator, AcrR family [Actinokineospora iranica]
MLSQRAADRTWGGTTLTDRKAARRLRLLEAGVDLLGAPEGPALSVRAVCRHAKLTERYFYESFPDRDELVLAVYEHVAAAARQALVDAVRSSPPDPPALARAAVTAFVELMVDDPRRGRVLLLAPLTDPALSSRGMALLPAFAALIREQLPEDESETDREMTAIGLVGALTHLFSAYLDGTLTVDRDQLVDHCVRLLTRA